MIKKKRTRKKKINGKGNGAVQIQRRRRIEPIRVPKTVEEWFGTMRSAYDAATGSEYKRPRENILWSGSGADFHYRFETDLMRTIENARELDRNDDIVGQAITRLATNVLRGGIRVDPQTGDQELDDYLAAKKKEWAESPDRCSSDGQHNLRALRELVLRHTIVDGDVFARLLDDETVELVEAHRCRSPKQSGVVRADGSQIVHGVDMDPQRRVRGYWITDHDDALGRAGPRRSYFHAARDEGVRVILHTKLPKRVSQTRGVSTLAPILDTAGIFSDVQHAVLVKQQLAALIAIIRERPEDDDEPSIEGDEGQQYGTREELIREDGTRQIIDAASPATEIEGDPGEKISGFSPNIPATEYFDHARLVLTTLAINLGLPVHVLLLDPSQTNFSGWRGAMELAREGFRRLQEAIAASFDVPIHEWLIARWIVNDPFVQSYRGREDVDPFGYVVQLPTYPYIEPLKDAQADVYQLANGLISPRRYQAKRGRDWKDIVDESIEDYSYAIRAAVEEARKISEKLSVEISWRELMPLPTSSDTANGSDETESKGGDDAVA